MAPLTELRLSSELAAFRAEVQAFLADEMAPEHTRGHADPSDLTGLDIEFERAHQRRAAQRGYLAISVPAALGGGGRPPSWKAVYAFEAAYHDAPSIDTALTLCGAPLIAFGTPAQLDRYLPPMIRGEVLACIGYTEHGAGSDLAAIEATARAHSGGFVLNGVKALVTGAHKAEWCLVLARTELKATPRSSMSMFLVALDTPGVEIERRATANGWTLCEITFLDVRLEADALLGKRGAGWKQVTAALVEERSGMAHLGWATRGLDELTAWARANDRDDAFETLAALGTELVTGYRLAERVMAQQDDGQPAHTEAAMAKVWSTELLQRIARDGLALVGAAALVWSPLFAEDRPDVPLRGRLAWEVLERIHPTISVGANELQRDSIGRAAFNAIGARS